MDRLDREHFARTQAHGVYPARHPTPPPLDDLRHVGVDLDGTLAVYVNDNVIGPPIWRNIRKVRELVAAGFKVVIHTVRPAYQQQMIEWWAEHYNVPISGVHSGKPLFALYIDDRARHESAESWLP